MEDGHDWDAALAAAGEAFLLAGCAGAGRWVVGVPVGTGHITDHSLFLRVKGNIESDIESWRNSKICHKIRL